MKSFRTFWRQLQKMAAWLAELGVSDSAMESTGVFWWPVYHALAQAGIEVCVCISSIGTPPRDSRDTPVWRSSQGGPGAGDVGCFDDGAPLLFIAGGVPVRRGGRLIGALSIGGWAPEQDHAFATKALGTLA